MYFVALKMLVGDRAKYLGIIMGITFSSLLITQQTAIFVGLMTRTYGAITDLGQPDIWVVDPKVQFIDDVKPMQETQLLRVRGVEGVEWAVPLYKGLLKARLGDGNFQSVNVVGLDDATLIGGPPEMVQGQIADLRRADGVIVDLVGATDKLAKPPSVPGGPKTPLAIGDVLEINDHRAIVVGVSRNTRTFQSQPVVYTTYLRALTIAPPERRLLSFVLVKAKPGQDLDELCARIQRTTGLSAYTSDGFKQLTVNYFLKYTGIPINFGIAVVLGFIVGTAVAGQTFYNFTLESIRQFGALKAMGAENGTLLRMIALQAVTVGSIGYGLGVGAASWIGFVTRDTELAFRMPWQLLLLSAGAVALICVLAALLSIMKVMRLEPAIVFKG
ncbi:MAG TPA: ABC transporter permease [Candidatus Eisenbacteria bacterium]|nr:ABC transporter permease [Candidatus Eisenbacteria bacterium]